MPSGVAGAVAVALGALGTLLWVFMLVAPWRLASGLLDARTHLDRAETALSAASFKAARYETLAAVAAAERARRGLEARTPLLAAARHLPRLGGMLGELPHLVAAAGRSAAAAEGALDVAQNLLRGPDKVVVRDPEDRKGGARIRVERIQEIGDTITAIRADVSAALAELRRVQLEALPRRARSAVRAGIVKARRTADALADAQAGFAILPAVLGANGPRTYLVGMQNSAEQRGTGGAILQFALISIVDGKPEFLRGATKTVYDVDIDRRQFDIPLPEDAWYVRGIPDARRFGNANWSPDWPLSARLTLAYARVADPGFPEISGVIAVDPIVMEKLLPGVGPYVAGQRGKQRLYVTANRVLALVLYKAYARYPNPKFRRARLRDIVDDFYENLFKPAHPTALVDGLSASLAQKHMQIWLSDPREERFVRQMNWDGGIARAPNSDYLFVVEQNVGGNKLDYFDVHRNQVDIRIEGRDAHVSAEARVLNNVFLPQPRWSMGDSGPFHRPMLNLYVPRDAELLDARYEGSRLATPPGLVTTTSLPSEHRELGKKVWSATFEIPPGEDAAMRLAYRVPGVVRTVRGRSTYRLIVQHQPKVHPEVLELRLDLPPGATAVAAPGWERDGKTLVWERPLEKDLDLEVSWRD